MLMQSITSAGAVSADWILTTSFVVIGALITGIVWIVSRNVIDTLKEIQHKVNEHDLRFQMQGDRNSLLEREIAVIKNEIARDNEQLADLIITKMRAISPPHNH